MGLLDHQELMIIKGVGPIPSDSVSAEQSLSSVNLMNAASGFSLIEWSPNIPSLKKGGIWADSSINDGRVLISGQNTNVIEKIIVNLSGATCQLYAAQFAALQRMIQDAREFWDSLYQTEPVYIRWWANGAPGPQYSLIYNIDMDVEFEDSNISIARITFNIEREYRWRGIHPGGNPKEWTAYKQSQLFNPAFSDFNSTAHSLVNSALIYNSVQWLNKSQISKGNYLDIPAAVLDGDLPPLVNITFDVPSGVGCYNLFLARSTKPTSVVLRDNTTTAFQFHDLAAAHVVAAYLGTDTSLANDTGGIIYPPASANARRANITFATDATNVRRLTWISVTPASAAFEPPIIDENMFRGRFAAFLRCRQDGGASGNIRMSLMYGNSGIASESITTDEVIPTLQAGAGNTADWPVTYMGEITIPIDGKIAISSDGRGVAANVDYNGFRIELFARRTVAAGVLYVSDLILIPIDECAGSVVIPNGSGHNIIADTTGYFARGYDEVFATTIQYAGATTNAGANTGVAYQGQKITLKPKKANRIYALIFDGSNLSTPIVSNIAGMYIDIVPCWSGIRDA